MNMRPIPDYTSWQIMVLEVNSSIPLYVQIKNYIIENIKNGVYKKGQRLPSERVLSIILGVSRMTTRQALLSLVQEGILESKPGKGTYVTRPIIYQQLGMLTSFSEEIHQRGGIPSTRVISVGKQSAGYEIARKLEVPVGTQVILLNRVRLADGNPVAIEASYLVSSLCPEILEKYDFSRESLYRVLREEYNLSLTWARQQFQARMPTLREQKLLEITSNSPVLVNDRVTFSVQDKPIEYVNSTYVGDQFMFTIILH
jgi:GntR family transcriptional regulator